MDLVQSMGKQNKQVTTIFLPEMISAVDMLNKTREVCGIKAENKFIFANTQMGHQNAWQVLNSMAHKAGCNKPELISSTRLRKYLATVCQVVIQSCNNRNDISIGILFTPHCQCVHVGILYSFLCQFRFCP